jgi:homeobox protein cut-like
VVTTQSKSASAAFFQAYSPLSEAPDPYPLLEASVDSLVTAEETVPRLNEENERLQRSVSSLTAQLERTEKTLDQERSSRQSVEKTRESKIQEVEQSWSAVLKEKEDNWASKEKALEEKADNLERVLKELKASYEVSQRLGQNEGDSGNAGATAAELEIVSSELDRTSMRLAEVEARNEQLRVELAQSTSHSKDSAAVEDDPVFLRLQSDNAALARKLDNFKFEKDSAESKWSTQQKTLERDLNSLKSERDSLREKVRKWGDYDSVKQELEVLKVRTSLGHVKEFTHTSSLSNSRLEMKKMVIGTVQMYKNRLRTGPPKAKAIRSSNFFSPETRSSTTN